MIAGNSNTATLKKSYPFAGLSCINYPTDKSKIGYATDADLLDLIKNYPGEKSMARSWQVIPYSTDCIKIIFFSVSTISYDALERNRMWSRSLLVETLKRLSFCLKNEVSFFFYFKTQEYLLAGYTATPVACGWEGVVLEVTRVFGQKQWGQRPKTS